jgi:hypothetical protein
VIGWEGHDDASSSPGADRLGFDSLLWVGSDTVGRGARTEIDPNRMEIRETLGD